MRWFEHAIWWQVHPLGFIGALVRPSGDHERQLTHRLGHHATAAADLVADDETLAVPQHPQHLA